MKIYKVLFQCNEFLYTVEAGNARQARQRFNRQLTFIEKKAEPEEEGKR